MRRVGLESKFVTTLRTSAAKSIHRLFRVRASAVKFGQVQQLIDEKQQSEAFRIPPWTTSSASSLSCRFQKGLECTQMQSERSANFMADVGEELTFQAIQFEKFLVGDFQLMPARRSDTRA